MNWLIPLVLAVAPPVLDCGENCAQYDQVLRLVETSKDVETCWFQDDVAQFPNMYWDFEVLQFPNGGFPVDVSYGIPATGVGENRTKCVNWAPLYAGLYYVRVRSCNAEKCSEWAESWNPNDTGNSLPTGLVFYIKLASPGGGVIE